MVCTMVVLWQYLQHRLTGLRRLASPGDDPNKRPICLVLLEQLTGVEV